MPDNHPLAAHASAAQALSRCVDPLLPRSGAVGVDAVHIPTWRELLTKGGASLAHRVYTEQERTFADGRFDRLSSRLAAKEAVLKVLGTGMRGIGLTDVEVVTAPEGAPSIRLRGAAERRRLARRLGPVAISLCHEEDVAYAVAIAFPIPIGGSNDEW